MPLGNSIESMDLGFALQARCLETVAGGSPGRGTLAPGSTAPGSPGSQDAPRPVPATGTSGFTDDQGAGQHRAPGHPPGPDERS